VSPRRGPEGLLPVGGGVPPTRPGGPSPRGGGVPPARPPQTSASIWSASWCCPSVWASATSGHPASASSRPWLLMAMMLRSSVRRPPSCMPSDRGHSPREPSDRGHSPREPSDRGHSPREPSDRGHSPREPPPSTRGATCVRANPPESLSDRPGQDKKKGHVHSPGQRTSESGRRAQPLTPVARRPDDPGRGRPASGAPLGVGRGHGRVPPAASPPAPSPGPGCSWP
jgi:hypothetical protein